MSDITINATERKGKSHLVRKTGFTPGIINSNESKEGILVKFETVKLKRLLRKQAVGTKIHVKISEEVKEGVIKEVQKNTLTDEIMHIVIYLTPKVPVV